MGHGTPLGYAGLLMAGMALCSALDHARLWRDVWGARVHLVFAATAAFMAVFGVLVTVSYATASPAEYVDVLRARGFLVSLAWPLMFYGVELYSGQPNLRFRVAVITIHAVLFTYNLFAPYSYVFASLDGVEWRSMWGFEYASPRGQVGGGYLLYAVCTLATLIWFWRMAWIAHRAGNREETRSLLVATSWMTAVLGLDMLGGLEVLSIPMLGGFSMLGFVIVMGHCAGRDLSRVRRRHVRELERIGSELNSSRERLRHSQKLELFGQIAGGIAHDFNNLLTAVLVHVELARRAADQAALPAARRHLAEIEGTAKRAAALTRKLLASSRRQFVNARLTHPDQIVSGLRPILAGVLGSEVSLEIECGAPDAVVRVDPTELEQVLVNLVVNAGDAMPDGEGRVRVATRVEGGGGVPATYVVVVEDTGEGMDQETLSRLFEPYFTTKPSSKGTGLGASTVHAIVTRAGGKVSVQSRPGRGTQFQLSFPRATPSQLVREEAEAKAARAGVGSGQESRSVVSVCDDDREVLDLTVQVLRSKGYRVSGFCDPRELLSEFDPETQLLVTDVAMPHLNGPELARAVHEKSPDVKVLFTSGYTAGVLDQHGFDEARAEFLPKPYGPAALVESVQHLLARRSAARRAGSSASG